MLPPAAISAWIMLAMISGSKTPTRDVSIIACQPSGLRDRADASQALNGVSELAVHALDAGRQLLGDRFPLGRNNANDKTNGKSKTN